jgi:hypothetical protein
VAAPPRRPPQTRPRLQGPPRGPFAGPDPGRGRGRLLCRRQRRPAPPPPAAAHRRVLPLGCRRQVPRVCDCPPRPWRQPLACGPGRAPQHPQCLHHPLHRGAFLRPPPRPPQQRLSPAPPGGRRCACGDWASTGRRVPAPALRGAARGVVGATWRRRKRRRSSRISRWARKRYRLLRLRLQLRIRHGSPSIDGSEPE